MLSQKETYKKISGLGRYPRLGYLLPVASVLVICCAFQYFDLYDGDIESARYMLSALIQSEAATIAIVITLSLIAVQLTASAYSPSAIEIFRKSIDLWALLVIYLAAIFYSLAVLRMIRLDLDQNLEIHIILSYFLGVACFTSLLPYIHYMLILLKPSTIIEKLSKEINKIKILEANPFRPILDIVRASMMKHDHQTMVDGLEMISERIIHIWQNEKINRDEEKIILEKMFENLISVCELALRTGDEDSANIIIEKIKEIGIDAAEKSLSQLLERIVLILGRTGRVAAEIWLERVISKILYSFREIGNTSLKRKFGIGELYWMFPTSELICKAAVERSSETEIEKVLDFFKDLGMTSVFEINEGITQEAKESLERIRKMLKEKKFSRQKSLAVQYLDNITAALDTKGLIST